MSPPFAHVAPFALRSSLVPALLILLGVLLCVWGSHAHAFDLLQYFPTPEGAKWEYRYTEASPEGACAGVRLVSVGSESFDQATLVTTAPDTDKCSGVRPLPEFMVTTDTLNTNIVAYRLVARAFGADRQDSTVRWVSPLLFMPTYSNIYQTYSSTGTVTEVRGSQARSAAYSATVKVVGLEDVVVPAGKFKSAVHLQLSERRSYDAPLATRVLERTDRWLVRGLGVVKVSGEILINEQRRATSQWQLLSAQVPAQAELPEQTVPAAGGP
jgi:hypothetical protein